MFTFKDYLVEAQFTEDDFARVLSVFERRLPKLLGAKLYRYGGADHQQKFSGFNSILYFFGNSAFAVRHKNGHILGIDVWKQYSINNAADFFIDVNELSSNSLIGVISKLAELIKAPKVGEFEVTNLAEAFNLQEMAKRVDGKTFYDLMVNAYGEEKVKRVNWAEIKKVADDNDVLIPGYVRAQKAARGFWNVTASPSGEFKQTKNDNIQFIKVSAQPPGANQFISAAELMSAKNIYTQISGSANEKPTNRELRDPETLYGHLSQLVDMVCKGTLKSLLVFGGPGSGKTFSIMKTIKDNGLTPGKDYVKLSGRATPISIYQTLFMFRDDGLVIFDDLDSMWGNKDATNILKAALDTSPVREISWISDNTINVSKMSDEKRKALFSDIDDQLNAENDENTEDEEDESEDDMLGYEGDKKKKISKRTGKIKFPSTFDFTGRVIFISNLKREQFDSAIMSRSAKINMDLSPEEILKRMRAILPNLGGDDVSLKDKEELLDELMKMHGRKELDAITMRDFVKGMNILRSGANNWRELLRYA